MATPRLSWLVVLAIASAPRIAAADPAPIAPVAPPAAVPAAIDLTPSFEIRDRGDAVEVIAHNIKAVRTAILPMRSRLEIPIAAGPAAKRLTPGDATVKLIELDGADANRMLSVKLGFERPDVKTLARYAQAIQVGDDLHVIVPRKVPTDGVAPKLPEPTIPPALAAAVAKLDPPATLGPRIDPASAARPEIKLDAKAIAKIEPIEAKPEAKPDARPAVLGPSLPPATVAAATTTTAKPVPAPAAKPARADPPLKQVLAPEADDAWSKISLYGALGLAALGAGIWLIRRRKGGHVAPHSSIEVIAQRSLGGKARIVWLSAGQREMIISVTAQQVRMLGQWRKTDAAGMPTAQTYHDARPDARSEMMDRLLEKTRAPHDQTATDQPDNLSIANHLPRTERSTGPVILPERRTGQMAAVSQFTMPERRTGSFAAVDGRGSSPDGSAPGGGRGSIDKPAERRTGSFAAVERPVERALSPAVSGILRLRGRTGQMPAVSDEVATGDVEADELWAREILAATGARR
ncbi:MAG: flagellar biosynthetic protein FliO [Kofleriaceae bacterium]